MNAVPHSRHAIDDSYARLRGDIVAGRLMPNQRLVEADLAAALGVSRSAVRTFLTRLEQEGLVVREPNRGARVRMVSEAEAVEITQARAVLEALAARQAALRATEDDIGEITAIHAEMPQLLAAGDLLGYSEANARLHARIVAASRHGTAQRLISGLKAQMVRFQYRTILVPGRSKESLSEHSAVVEAIVARDPEVAEAGMRHHLSHVTATLSKVTAAQGRQGAGPPFV